MDGDLSTWIGIFFLLPMVSMACCVLLLIPHLFGYFLDLVDLVDLVGYSCWFGWLS